MPDLLFEIGTEEIPAGYLAPALEQMKHNFSEQSKRHHLAVQSIYCTGTPRRLSMFATGLPKKQEDTQEEVQGPSAAIAFDKTGRPTKAAMGFARSHGIDIKDIQIKQTSKGDYCFAIKKIEGQETICILPEILVCMIRDISFPKSMKWKGNNLFFARPIRSILALFGDRIIPLEINGIKADRLTYGHPFLSGRKIILPEANWDNYKLLLRQEKVIVDMNERREILRTKIKELMKSYGSDAIDEDLLEEVTNLVEYPNATECGFDEEFLDLPPDVIETAMKAHQRYFPVRKKDGKIIGKFIAVLNRDEDNTSAAIRGNERVLKARLADARFFWKEDRKIPLEKRVDDLKNLIFLERLGDYYDKTNRIVELADFITHRLISSGMLAIEYPACIKRAALLCKADLLTEMVREFPSLQGIMGREYAKWDGEEPSVAIAIAEHYMPRFATDTIPSSRTGAVVGLADKFDTIASCFSIGLIPTGSQDPYSLRRHAYGIIRIMEEHKFPLELSDILSKSLYLLSMSRQKSTHRYHSEINDQCIPSIKEFFRDRLFNIHVERGYHHDIIHAVLNAGTGYDNIYDFSQRIKAISHISEKDWWPDLATVVERTFNIGKKANSSGKVDERLFSEPEEYTLWNLYKEHEANIRKLIDEKKYEDASYAYNNTFAKPVHIFFDKVFVNVEDEKIRNNRLLMIKEINKLYSERIADLSQIIIPR